MERFTIKDIENLTGIKAHTFRIWEQRYKIFNPKRKESKHRYYDNDDLKKLLRIAFLYHNGWKASRISSLSDQQIIYEIQQSAIDHNNNSSIIIGRLLEFAIDFDEESFKKTLAEVIRNKGFEYCVLEICYPFLLKVGLLWSTNHIIPAQEHFSSYVIQHLVICETDKLPQPSSDKSIVLICPEGEYHELPLLFMNYLFRKHSWQTIYLGKNCGEDIIEELQKTKNISHIYLHLLTNFTGFETSAYFEKICRKFPDISFVASGDTIKNVELALPNLKLLKTSSEIQSFFKSI
jgi:Predicted transcriptional regulators